MEVKTERDYSLTISQIKGLLEGEKNLIANLSNISAVLKENHQFFWVGFYLVENNELILGPFQGPVACTRISKGKGVCGSAWDRRETIVVKDVHEFPGHIACNANSKSEIVVPLFRNNEVYGVLDIDSDQLADFDENDRLFMEEIAKLISENDA